MARPTKFTDERADKIISAIRVGATFRLACQYGGITEETFSQWRKSKPEFSERVKEAEGAGAVGWLAVIEKAAPKNWQAAAWKLERRYPHEYGRTVQEQEQSGDVRISVTYTSEIEAPADRVISQLPATAQSASIVSDIDSQT